MSNVLRTKIVTPNNTSYYASYGVTDLKDGSYTIVCRDNSNDVFYTMQFRQSIGRTEMMRQFNGICNGIENIGESVTVYEGGRAVNYWRCGQ